MWQVVLLTPLLFFAVFWSALTLSFDGMIGGAALQQVRALSYSTVAGSIAHSEVDADYDSDGTTYYPDIRYAYSVGGKQLEGNRCRYGQMWTNDRSAQCEKPCRFDAPDRQAIAATLEPRRRKLR